MVNVKDLLSLPVFKNVQVLAGKSGLDRNVEHVTVMEVPDIKRWLKGNDFLLKLLFCQEGNGRTMSFDRGTVGYLLLCCGENRTVCR